MLVLSRRRGQRIVMPQCNLTVSVIGIKGNTVRLGITAPPEMAVHREELWQEMQEESPMPRDEAVEAVSEEAALAAFAAELRDAARHIARRHGLADGWLEREHNLPPALVAPLQAPEASDAGSPSGRSCQPRLPR